MENLNFISMNKSLKIFSTCLILAVSVFSAIAASAQLRLPAVLSSGMVLQQKDSVTFWGWAGPGEKVYVTTGWNNHTDSTITTNMATWKLKLLTPGAGGPFVIAIRSRNTINLTDVLVGEVWICSGQSNMEWSFYNGTSDIAQEFPAAYNKNIRLFHVPKAAAQYPQEDVNAIWTVCDSSTIKSFSSVGYFFGKKLQQELNIPIGIINASWGGTPAETWTPEETIKQDPLLKTAATQLKDTPWWPVLPGQAFNGMISPITNFNIAGAIWYQGEGNTVNNETYHQLFTTMIDAWRLAWNKLLPFYYVQIAPYNYGRTNEGALIQEQQTKTMTHPKTGMIVVTDLIDSVTNIHPSRKKPVGERLANWALAETYGKSGIIYKSPELISAIRDKDKMVLRFSNAPAGLMVNGPEPTGFYISGDKEGWYPAKAKVQNDVITIWNPQVKAAYHVRYGFGNTIVGNISSKEGLPIVPFRTDDWKVNQSAVK